MRGATDSPPFMLPAFADFNPHSPCGERRRPVIAVDEGNDISIHTPHAGSDRRTNSRPEPKAISIHTPHAGSDLRLPCPTPTSPYFNPHSPCGERPGWMCAKRLLFNFNPHSPCGERRQRANLGRCLRNFNPHSPCGERRLCWIRCQTRLIFQSTLPMRGATTIARAGTQ